MKKESLRSRLPRYLQDKLSRGKKLTHGDMDQAAYEHMRGQKKGFTITDAIFNINRGKANLQSSPTKMPLATDRKYINS